jgi:hypothetical protein
METAENPLKLASSLATQLIARQWRALGLILVVGCLISLQLEDAIRGVSMGSDSSRWLLQLSMGLWDLFEGVCVFLILSWGIPDVRQLKAANLEQHPFSEPYLNAFFAEYLRMLATILMFGLLLIIPGMIAYCFLIFVPYIALFSKPYRQDKVAALDYSYRLAKRFIWRIAGVFALSAALQLGFEFLPHLYVELYVWPARVTFMALSLLIGIWTYSFMFVTFERAVTEDKDGFDV